MEGCRFGNTTTRRLQDNEVSKQGKSIDSQISPFLFTKLVVPSLNR